MTMIEPETFEIRLKLSAGMVYKADLRDALNMSSHHFCDQTRLMERVMPAFALRYAFFKYKSRIPISIAKTIILHIYPDARVVWE